MAKPVWKKLMQESAVRKVRDLVRATLKDFGQNADERGLYRRLVGIGRQRAKTVSLKAYGLVLADEGLSASRVSEVRRILSCDRTAKYFLDHKLGVVDALNKARTRTTKKNGSASSLPRSKKRTFEEAASKLLDDLAFLFQRRAERETGKTDGHLRDPSTEQVGVFLIRYHKGEADLTAPRSKPTLAERRRKRRAGKLVNGFFKNAKRAAERRNIPS